MDIMRVDTADGHHRYAMCTACYGYMGDLMHTSEGMRWMGPSRYNLAGVHCCCSAELQMSVRFAMCTVLGLAGVHTSEVLRWLGRSCTTWLVGLKSLASFFGTKSKCLAGTVTSQSSRDKQLACMALCNPGCTGR